MWEIAFFSLKLGLDLEMRGTSPPKIPRSTPPPLAQWAKAIFTLVDIIKLLRTMITDLFGGSFLQRKIPLFSKWLE